MKSGFKRTINWNKYQAKVSTQTQNQCLDYFLDPSFEGANIPFVLLFEDNAVRTGHRILSSKGRNKKLQHHDWCSGLFDQPQVTRTCESIRKVATGQGDDYTTDCLLDYPYFKENYKLIAIYLSNCKPSMLIKKWYSKLILHGI